MSQGSTRIFGRRRADTTTPAISRVRVTISEGYDHSRRLSIPTAQLQHKNRQKESKAQQIEVRISARRRYLSCSCRARRDNQRFKKYSLESKHNRDMKTHRM